MTLEDLEDILPNGFHDATISELTWNYEKAELRLQVDILMELPKGTSPEDPNWYRSAELTFHGVLFSAVEAPNPGSAFKSPGCIWFKVGTMEEGAISDDLMKSLPAGILRYSLFILDWWSHIHVVAADVSFIWSDTRTPILAKIKSV